MSKNKASNQKENSNKKFSIGNLSSIGNIFQYAQDLIEKKIEGEKLEVVLKPSTYWAKIICWSLIGGTTFGIGWLTLAKTEEIIVTRGKIQPIEGAIRATGVDSDAAKSRGKL